MDQNDLIEMMQSMMSSQVVSQLSSNVNANQESTETAMSVLIPTMIGALNRNVQSPGGAEALASALDADHDGSILDDLAGWFGQGGQQADPYRSAGIIKHLFGDREEAVAEQVGNMAGMDRNAIMQMMIKLAPVVLGMLGKQRSGGQGGQGLDIASLIGLLNNSTQKHEQRTSNNLSGFMRLLDRDGDGSLKGEAASLAKTFIKGFFKR